MKPAPGQGEHEMHGREQLLLLSHGKQAKCKLITHPDAFFSLFVLEGVFLPCALFGALNGCSYSVVSED